MATCSSILGNCNGRRSLACYSPKGCKKVRHASMQAVVMRPSLTYRRPLVVRGDYEGSRNKALPSLIEGE